MTRIALAMTLLLCSPPALVVADVIVGYRLEVENLNGHPLADNTIQVGQDFQLAAFVNDVRVPQAPIPGVFEGVVNVAYDSLATIPNGATIDHGSIYTLGPTADLSQPGEILRAGGFDPNFQDYAGNPGEKLLWTLQMHAESVGTEHFTSSFDSTPGDDTLVYGIDTAIPAEQINFGTATLAIVPEPSSGLLAALGLLVLGTRAWRRRALGRSVPHSGARFDKRVTTR